MAKLKLMLKKIFFASSAFLLLAVGTVSANTISPDYPVPDTGGVRSNDQYYSVVFDGEGEAAVAAKFNIFNNGVGTIDTVNIDIPAKGLRLINTVQEAASQNCARYDYTKQGASVCLDYGGGYYSNNYYTLQPEVQKLKKVYNLSINLQRSIPSQGSGVILIYYKAEGYVKSYLGLRNFDFETAKIDSDVDSVRVAVNVQEGFALKGSSAKTNYAPNFSALSESKSLSGAADSGVSAFSSRIVNEAGFVRETQGLDPGENFVVKGSYASSAILLYLPEVVKILVVLAVIGLVFWVFYKKWGAGHLQVPANIHPLIQVVGASLGSSVSLIVVAFLGIWFIERLSQSGDGALGTFLALLILLLLLVISVTLIFGPAVYFGIRKGLTFGLISVGASVIILIIFTVILIVVLGSFDSNQVVPLVE